MKKLLKIIFYTFSVFAIIFISLTVWYFTVTKDVKFDEKKLTKNETGYIIYDGESKPIQLNAEKIYVANDEIPEFVKKAFIAVEDRRFYTHGGIDFRSLLRATRNNLISLSTKEGGSTISQQLIKNTFLSGEKTVNRKMKELKLTMELEKRYTKDEILEIYLNTVYFGEGAVGIGKASKAYFGSEVKDLTVSEGALLAGLIKSPNNYDPYKNYDYAISRRNTVLLKMREENYITELEYEKYKNEEISLNYESFYDNRNYSYNIIADNALSLLCLEKLEDLNGFKIYTELDRNLSESITTPYDYGIKCNYSIVVIDNESKFIVASDSDVGDIKRCPASSAKPWLVYAPAIEEKYITEATLIDDSPTTFGNYTPKNYGDRYYGYTSVKDCLAKSLNVPSVKIVNGLGLSTIKNYADKLGVSYENDDLSVALGNLSGGITLTQLAGAYLPFSNGGNYSKPSFITKIVNPKGKTVYSYIAEETKVFSEETAFIITDALSETVKSGTAKKLNALNFDIYAKTGTNGTENGNIDAYCVAYTKEYTVAVWLGNADFTPMDNNISGGSYPTAMCYDIFNKLYKNNLPEKFKIPKGIIKAKLDEDEYKNQKLYLSQDDKSAGLYFYFIKGTEPKTVKQRTITPNVISYKISYNKRKIKITVKTEERVFYKIYDEDMNEIFSSQESKNFFTFDIYDYNKTYQFYLMPYTVTDGETVDGEIIKLPAVKPTGKNDNAEKIKDDEWWNY